jgi:hypothetical protein
VGLYDENLKVLSDWKLFILAMCKFNMSYRHVPFEISVCSRDGISCRPENFPILEAERKLVINQYFPAFVSDYLEADGMRDALFKNDSKFLNRVVRKLRNVF